VGIGEVGSQIPVMVVEPWPEDWPTTDAAREQLVEQCQARLKEHPLTAEIDRVLIHKALPVDIRHNAKIFREKLSLSVAKQIEL
jgi:hypothetical protein